MNITCCHTRDKFFFSLYCHKLLPLLYAANVISNIILWCPSSPSVIRLFDSSLSLSTGNLPAIHFVQKFGFHNYVVARMPKMRMRCMWCMCCTVAYSHTHSTCLVCICIFHLHPDAEKYMEGSEQFYSCLVFPASFASAHILFWSLTSCYWVASHHHTIYTFVPSMSAEIWP